MFSFHLSYAELGIPGSPGSSETVTNKMPLMELRPMAATLLYKPSKRSSIKTGIKTRRLCSSDKNVNVEVTPNLTFGHKFKIHWLKYMPQAWSHIFLKSQNICFLFVCLKFCMHNIVPEPKLLSPESKCLQLYFDTGFSNRYWTGHGVTLLASRNICIFLCSAPAPVTGKVTKI